VLLFLSGAIGGRRIKRRVSAAASVDLPVPESINSLARSRAAHRIFSKD